MNEVEIYVISNSVNNLVYVGQTARGITLRFYEHIVSAYKGKRTPLNDDILKFGPQCFRIKLLASASNAGIAGEIEGLYISEYQSTDRSFGYNQNFGGRGMKGMHHSLEWRAAHSIRMKGANHPGYGKPKSEETKRKIGAAKLGKRITKRRILPMDSVVKEYQSGSSLRDIAKRYGGDKKTVGSRLKELGIVLRPAKGRQAKQRAA